MKKKITLSVFAVSFLLITFFSCTKKVAKLQGPNDTQMYAWAIDTSGRYYYQNDSTNQIAPAPEQGGFHGPYKFRFNSKVKNALSGDGKLAVGNSLPDSSVIVKVTYTGTTVNGYSVIFKLNQAWSWGMYLPGGQVVHSVTSDASLCLSCHNHGNRDQVLTFQFH